MHVTGVERLLVLTVRKEEAVFFLFFYTTVSLPHIMSVHLRNKIYLQLSEDCAVQQLFFG